MNENEALMWSRYYGRVDLLYDDKFWDDSLENFKESQVNVPIPFNMSNIRWLHDMIDCPPECDECCKYTRTHLEPRDMNRVDEQYIKYDDSGKPLLDTKDGCPYLKDSLCSIYNNRPNLCWMFPMQGGTDKYIQVRLKCKEAVKMIRTAYNEIAGDRILMPNLILLKKENNETSSVV